MRLSESKYCLRLFSSARGISTAYQEKTIIINDKKINYMVVGQGPRTLFFNTGLLGSISSHFGPQVTGLDNHKFTKVFWETPGFAKSRPPLKKFHIGTYEEDVDTAHSLLTELGFAKYSVCGWSDGGRPSMIFAAKYPESVEKLVIWSTSSFINREEPPRLLELRNVATWPESLKQFAYETYSKEEVHSFLTDVYETNIKFLERGSICKEFLKDIICPTLILHGIKDNLVPHSHADHLHWKIKGSRLYKFPDGKHLIHLKYSEEFNRIVTRFLSE